MGYDFSAGEIFDVACQMERNGADFYRKMSEKISENSTRKMLLDFSSMEKAHEKVFESMKKGLTAHEKEQTVFDPEEETVSYLKAMADVHVFDSKADKDFLLSDDMSEKAKLIKILRSAIDLEWASISFYLGIKEFVSEDAGKIKIDGIIKEEMRHVRLLSNRLSA